MYSSPAKNLRAAAAARAELSTLTGEAWRRQAERVNELVDVCNRQNEGQCAGGGQGGRTWWKGWCVVEVLLGVSGEDKGNRSMSKWEWSGTTIAPDRKSTRLNSSHSGESRMPSSA